MIKDNILKYSRKNFPKYHIADGLALVALLLYFLYYLYFDFLLDLPLMVHLFMFVFCIATLFDVFKRLVLCVEFDAESKQISITYFHFFFIKRRVTFSCSTAGYLQYNSFSFLKHKKLSKGITDLHFYDERKYIAKVSVSPSGWNSNQLQEMHKVLSEFAHEFKMSPFLL